MRYWYTYDTTPIVAQADQCSYAFAPPTQCTNITRTWVTGISPAKTMADAYMQIGFAAAAGNLNAGATAEFGLGWHKNDWTNFTQSNDYSYNAATAFTTHDQGHRLPRRRAGLRHRAACSAARSAGRLGRGPDRARRARARPSRFRS